MGALWSGDARLEGAPMTEDLLNEFLKKWHQEFFQGFAAKLEDFEQSALTINIASV